MRSVFGGAVLVIAGIAAFIEAHSHHTTVHSTRRTWTASIISEHRASGLSQTAYDLLRIGAWALVIIGGLLIVTGLIRYWGAQARQ